MNDIIKYDSLTDGGEYKLFNRRSGQYAGQDEGCILLGTFFGSGMRLPTTFKEQFEKYYQVCRFSGLYDMDDFPIFEHDFITILDARQRKYKMACDYDDDKKAFMFVFDSSDSRPDWDYETFEFEPVIFGKGFFFKQNHLISILKAVASGNNCFRIMC